ncbi:tRNA-uridine aminocarboxypropyltransferase [Vibrio maerlii]|uniref:tRNA-uridine aminocarboxypropyltransferase n=1 Tax=Vibrio maerlii TaxID=2231648 RepID=UPI000E3E6C88|nr:tRNA-uridine aminocarboxypropyltransferase [Vibrio maerlii]
MSRYCSKCGKAKVACICQYIRTIDTDVQLIILQHKTETQRPLGTAKILSLSLANSVSIVGEDFSHDTKLTKLLADQSFQHWVLYPSDNSMLITEQVSTRLTQSNLSEKPVRLIVIDATWKKAYKIWQLSTNLHNLQAVHLPENIKGNYRVRKAPSDNSLSTVEATAHALALIEPQTDFSPLFEAFDSMVDDHIKAMPPGVYERNYLNP